MILMMDEFNFAAPEIIIVVLNHNLDGIGIGRLKWK
jgi:hypothetical protein